MPDGNQPFSGGSGPTWNDAMIAAGQIMRTQYEGETPAPTRRELAQRRLRRRASRSRRVIGAVVSTAFLIGGLIDVVSGRPSQSWMPFFIAVAAGLWTRYLARLAARLASEGPASVGRGLAR